MTTAPTIEEVLHDVLRSAPGVRLDDCRVTTYGALPWTRDVPGHYDTIPDDAPVVVARGWMASDAEEYAPLYYADEDSAEDSAAEYFETGEWAQRDETYTVSVVAWRPFWVILPGDEEGEYLILEGRGDESGADFRVEPPAPPCAPGREHDWDDNAPVYGVGAYGVGGGTGTTYCCRHCGSYKDLDHWRQSPTTGVISEDDYTSYRDPDERSLAWVQSTTDHAA